MVVKVRQFRYQRKARMRLAMCHYLVDLSCTVFEIWRIIGPTFAVDSGCLSLAHSLWVNPYIQGGEIWTRETIGTSLYRVVRSVFGYLNRYGVTRKCVIDRRTDRLSDSKCRAALRCAANDRSDGCFNCEADICEC